MTEKNRKRIRVHKKDQNITAGKTQEISGGRYYCDYSPRYEEAYDIYEKAKKHARNIRQEKVQETREIKK